MQNVNELHIRIVRAAECITSEMPVNTWQETIMLMCHATNGAIIEIC